MQRFLILIVLLSLSLPVGLSIAGCGHNTNNYCLKNGHAYGPTTNQVAYITLQPETTGLSLAWGQTASLSQPGAYNCLNATETVSSYTYATTNNALADISPTGIVCAGSWNRYSEGTVAPYTVCTPPSGAAVGNCGTTTSPTAGTNTACGVAQVSATAAAVTSNPVNVYVHPPISSIVIGSTAGTTTSSGTSGTTTAGGAITQSQCYSQDTTVQNPAAPGTPETLLSETEVLGADGTPIPMADVGTITYTASPATVVTINNTTNPTSATTTTGTTTGTTTTTTTTTTSTTTTTANPNGTVTANQPGAAVITASLSGSSSAAGYFYTCPPKTINLAINGQTGATTPVTITASAPQTITATVTDTNGVTLNGTALAYTSTEPQNISVASTGVVTPLFPSTASIIGICQPPGCNPSPVTGTGATGTQIGFYGTGLPVVSNRLQVQSPGQVSDQIWMASSKSQYFSEVDLTTGTTGTTVQLPYVPNSMVADQGVNSLYFGSYRELMIYSTATNSLTKADTNVPGVVLAVSPTNSTVIINDQLRQVIYLYNVATGTSISTDGLATHAQFSPDGNTVYVTGPNALYIYNSNTGWSTDPITNPETASCTPALNNDSPLAPNYTTTTYDPYCGRDLTVMVPQVGPFVAGSTTTAYSYCANTTVNPAVFYPLAATVEDETDHLAATPNGDHIIGASATTDQLVDLWLYSDAGQTTLGPPTGACPQASSTTSTGFTLYPYTVPPIPLTGITPSEIDQVVSSPNSAVAFVMYQSGTTPTGLLPAYEPSMTANAAGTLTNLQLKTYTAAPGDPIAGAFSPDASIFFVSTDGDSLVHLINTTNPLALTDYETINPALTTVTGQQPTAPQFIVVKSRTTT